MLKKSEAQQIYRKLFKGLHEVYEEEIHCPLILEHMANEGRISSFCKATNVPLSTFYGWRKKHTLFRQCYEIGLVYAREKFEKEVQENMDNPDFNHKSHMDSGLRNIQGLERARLRVDVNPMGTPWEQYQDILQQCSDGDFRAEEIKQLMESVNVGVRVYESFKLQKEVDKMKEDLSTMSQRNGNNIIPIRKAKK